MPRTSGSTELFQLIRSLNANEKGFFKKYASRHSEKGNEYLRLFYAIDKMKEYDEQPLKKNIKHLPVVKNYLYNLLMDALVLYHNTEKNISLYLANKYARTYILEMKGLSDKAIKERKHARDVAAKHHHTSFEYLFARTYHQLNNVKLGAYKPSSYYKQVYDELTALLHREQAHLRYNFEYGKLRALALKMKGEMQDSVTESDIDFTLLKTDSPQVHINEKRTSNEALINFYLKKNEVKSAYQIACEYLKTEKRQKRDVNNVHYYSRALMYASMASMYNNKYAEAHTLLNQLGALKTTNEHVNTLNRMRFVNFKLSNFCFADDYSSGAEFCSSVIDNYPEQFDGENPVYYYDGNIIYSLYLLFFARDFQKCIYLYIHHIKRSYLQKKAPLAYRDVELFWLMIQTELGNYHLLPALTKSIARKFKKLHLLQEHTKTLLDFFNDLGTKGSQVSTTKYIKLLKEIYSKLPADDHSQHLISGIKPYEQWIESLPMHKHKR